MTVFMMRSSESGKKFRNGINRKMKLRKVYSAQVSSTICPECETRFTKEPQTTNDETCNELQELSQTDPRKEPQLDPTKNIIITQSDTCSLNKFQDRNLTTFLDLSTHMIDHPAVSCFSQSCVSEREPGAQSQDTQYQSSQTQPY